MASISAAISAGWVSGSIRCSTQSSRTKLKAASISGRPTAVSNSNASVRWQLSGSSDSIAGTAAKSQVRRETAPRPAT